MYWSRRIRKPTICIRKTKGANHLCSNYTAHQRLYFRYTDTIPLFLHMNVQSSSLFSVALQPSLFRTCPETKIVSFHMRRLIFLISECVATENIQLEQIIDKTILKPDLVHAVVNELGVKQTDPSNKLHVDRTTSKTVIKTHPVSANKQLFDTHLQDLLLNNEIKRKEAIMRTSETNQVQSLVDGAHAITTTKPIIGERTDGLSKESVQREGLTKLRRKSRRKQLKQKLNKITRKNRKSDMKEKLSKKLRKSNKFGKRMKSGRKRTPGKRIKWLLRRKLNKKKQEKTKPRKQLRFLKSRKGKQGKKKPQRKFWRLRLRKRLQNSKKTKAGDIKDKTKQLKKKNRQMKERRWILRLKKRLQKAMKKKPKSLKPKPTQKVKNMTKDKTSKFTEKQARKLKNKNAKRRWQRIKLLKLLKLASKNGKTANKSKKSKSIKQLRKQLRLLQNKGNLPGLKVKLAKKLQQTERGKDDHELTKTKETKQISSGQKQIDNVTA